MERSGATAPPLLRPVRAASLVEHVAESMREAILDGRLPAGTRIVERRVADELGVSTIAVREAFARLREEGFIVRVPRRGAFVASITPEFVRDVSRVRIVLEQLAAELATARWHDGHHAEARAIVDEMEELVATGGSRKRLYDVDVAFHRLIWEIAGSETLLGVLDNLQGRLGRARLQVWTSLAPDELPAVVDVHREWLDAVESRDVERVRATVEAHIANACERLVAAVTMG